MYLRIILILCAVVSGVSRISEPDLNAVNFADNIAGRKLNKSLISEMEVDSETSCQFECVEEERCQSYNFRTIKGDSGKFKCQLSDSDRFFGFANFTEDKDFIYRGLMSACEEDRFQCGKNGICIPNYVDGSARCKCDDGYTGKPCKGKSCSQLFQDGFNVSGLYTINPDGGKPIQVLCDMTTDGGGWTVFQRRLDGSVDFYLGWESYKNGFGNLNGEFWLGNDNLHLLTAVDNVMMRVDLEDFDGNITYAEYKTFKVAGEADKYQLLIGGYNGTAGDSMTGRHNDMQFSTKDQDNDIGSSHCAQLYKGAWWYDQCHRSNLNGLYLNGRQTTYANGVNWYAFRGYYYSLRRTEMKVKTKG
ncbi:microfibril-associated glycoprotein 4-like [Pocillopora verrucosa]|uniref:microfibril-associated glycoprotein 4-like n=1 Tax=Pocillopora verrucosa TaxID=203993 RepID=UPI0033426385